VKAHGGVSGSGDVEGLRPEDGFRAWRVGAGVGVVQLTIPAAPQWFACRRGRVCWVEFGEELFLDEGGDGSQVVVGQQNGDEYAGSTRTGATRHCDAATAGAYFAAAASMAVRGRTPALPACASPALATVTTMLPRRNDELMLEKSPFGIPVTLTWSAYAVSPDSAVIAVRKARC
jgi:hypothetical protein